MNGEGDVDTESGLGSPGSHTTEIVTNYGGAIPQRKLGVFHIPAIITGISKAWHILDSWSGRTSIVYEWIMFDLFLCGLK